MRNRYYDTARQFAPTNIYQRPEPVSRNKVHSQDKPSVGAIATGQSPKLGDKNDNKASSDAALNASNQEQVYIIDDPSSNDITADDDDDSQMKYLYSFYKNRLSSF